MKTLPVKDIQNIEQYAIHNLSISEDILMENAGSIAASYIKDNYSKDYHIIILAGKGNNGGDGFVTARHLISYGYDTTIYTDCIINNNACGKNLNILKHITDKIYQLNSFNIVDNDKTIIIDALFGTGLNREITGIYKDIIDYANQSKGIKISLDIPSGLYADSPYLPNTIFKADITFTFIALKYALNIYPAKEYAGKVILSTLSIPDNIIKSDTIYITKENLPKLKKRDTHSHKGSYGKALTIGGSKNMTGAVHITSLACLSCGAGTTTCAYSDDIVNPVSSIPEIMGFPYRDNKELIDFIKDKSALSFGNGMGRSENVKLLLKDILISSSNPIVIDADGINALDINDLGCNRDIVLTPHLKEFSRISSISVEDIEKDPVSIAREFALKYKVTLVLKSTTTIIANKDGLVYIMNFGNTALAKGGSGDALAGNILSLLTQGYTPTDASILGVYILGRSAEIISKYKNEAAAKVTDIINYYSEALNEIRI